MLIVQNNRNKTFPQQTGNNDSHDRNFKQALYRNSNVHRLIIHDYLKQSVLSLSTWYTVSLELVTEFGLPAQTSLFTSSQMLPVSCQLLVLDHSKDLSYYTTPSYLHIQYRLSKVNDSWKNLQLGVINLEYKITLTSHQKIPRNVFIRFQPVGRSSNDQAPLSICLGPFKLSSQLTLQSSTQWDNTYKNPINLYRVLPLPKHNAQSLFQEVWDNGTSGKLWDSALIMTQVFSQLIKYDKNCLSGKRLLDLSAGIGCVGLSIDMLCRIFKTDNPPEIVLTDLEEALPLIKGNQRLNHIPFSSRISIKKLAWGDKKDIDRVTAKCFDYVLALDLLYNTIHFPSLISTFYNLLDERENTTIIMGYKPRGLKQSEENLFFNECRRQLSVEKLDLDSLCREFIGRHLGHISLLQNTTAVCFYKITKKTFAQK